ncbi:hypothetical protein NC652_037916 [Populus alba x Populus x berolinensis]|nr:hypothetical protein NC652_037916 [Populus alba x Populus x berolinensis]
MINRSLAMDLLISILSTNLVFFQAFDSCELGTLLSIDAFNSSPLNAYSYCHLGAHQKQELLPC